MDARLNNSHAAALEAQSHVAVIARGTLFHSLLLDAAARFCLLGLAIV